MPLFGGERKLITKKEIIVIAVAIVLTTAGIKASDSLLVSKEHDDGCGADMVFVPSATGGFCVDIYEASPGEDCLYQNNLNLNKTRINLSMENCKAVSEKGKNPWSHISRDQAALACAKAGKRLASAKEWYQAALGTPDINNSWEEEDCQVNSNWPKQPGLTGTGEKCVSSFGAFDMIGNVWEWVDGVIEDSKYLDTELPNSGFVQSLGLDDLPAVTSKSEENVDYNNDYFWINKKGARAIARGGSWVNKSEAGQYAVYSEVKSSFIGEGIGFRCVK